MNFLADESIDRQIVDRLRQEGHLVRYIAEIEPGISDDTVLNMANQETSLLLTADKDFGEMVFRQRYFTVGIVLVRLAGLSPTHKAEIVASAINQHIAELWLIRKNLTHNSESTIPGEVPGVWPWIAAFAE